MKDGFLKVAAATPRIRVADCAYNASRVEAMAAEAAENGAALLVFPELCLTASTCGDLFLQDTLLRGAEQALARVLDASARHAMVMVVGMPLRLGGALYNAAAVMCRGKLLGIVPKQTAMNCGGRNDSRYFTSGKGIAPTTITVCGQQTLFGDRGKLLGIVPKQTAMNCGGRNDSRYFTSGKGIAPTTITVCGQQTLFGDGLLFRCADMPDFVLGCEICEDLWAPVPPSARLCAAGATVIANPSATCELVGRAAYRRQLVEAQSARLLCGYLCAEAGLGESTQDLVFSGHNLIAENGVLLTESSRFGSGILYSELDLSRLTHERRRMNTLAAAPDTCTEVQFDLPVRDTVLTRSFAQSPFIPDNQHELETRCEEILHMQAVGLATRMQHARCKTAVIGLSGGLDSTLALVVTVHAFDLLGIDHSGIHAVTMPCFGTTTRTKSNAMRLAEAYGASLHTVDIKASVNQHFADIGHSWDNHNVTFENAQARTRTLVLMDLANEFGGMVDIKASVNQHFADIGHSWDNHNVTFENAQARTRTLVLMDLANEFGGMVIGTGDLSELALGWATYNGDHMSMYGVNGSIPKTLVRYLTAYEAAHSPEELKAILLDVLNTPVSPELLPPKDGEISQKTEELVGP